MEVITEKALKGFEKGLPGPASQLKMAPMGRKMNPRPDTIQKRGAVMAIFYPGKDQAELLLTKRQSYQGVHADQISFPGGKVELFDENELAAALRETMEEIGIVSDEIRVLGALSPLYIPVSNFLVQPFLGIMHQKPVFKLSQREVKEIVPFEFSNLYDEEVLSEKDISTGMGILKVPCYQIKEHFIWGATAMIMSEIADLLKS